MKPLITRIDASLSCRLMNCFLFFVTHSGACHLPLSKYAGEEPDTMSYFDEFIRGFAKQGKLTKAEANAIPDQINLRILSNIVYFVGRHIAGEDNISRITSRILNYERRVNWVKSNGDAISGRIIEEMGL
jgi:homoserine kinase type II